MAPSAPPPLFTFLLSPPWLDQRQAGWTAKECLPPQPALSRKPSMSRSGPITLSHPSTRTARSSSALTVLGTSSIVMSVSCASDRAELKLMTGSQNSNVVQFISMLKKDNKREQMVYYQVTTDSELPCYIVRLTRVLGRNRDLHL